MARLLVSEVPRKPRIQFPGATFHVYNRGNYRRDLFEEEEVGARFETALFETMMRMNWLCHAYAVMSNHFHLVLQIQAANLSEGMQWLQGSFANRFNRFRHELGCLFQGRYGARLVQSGRYLASLVNYVHLNPVRAGLVSAADLSDYENSSYPKFLRQNRPARLVCPWIHGIGLDDSEAGWKEYGQFLIKLNGNPLLQKAAGFQEIESAWAFGDQAWQQALLKGLEETGRSGAPSCEAAWETIIRESLLTCGKSETDVQSDSKGAAWKVSIVREARKTGNVPFAWLAARLNMGAASSVRAYLCAAKAND